MASKFSAIYAIAKSPQLSMSDEELHLLVGGLTGKDSLKDLTQKEISSVVVRLQEMKDSVDGEKKQRNFTRRGNRSTERQRKKMYMLMKDLGWNDARVRGFSRKMVGTETIEWLNHEQCSVLIEGMKKLLTRQEVDADGKKDNTGEQQHTEP